MYSGLILHLKNSVPSRFDLYSQKVALARREKAHGRMSLNDNSIIMGKKGGGANTQNDASGCDQQTLWVLHTD